MITSEQLKEIQNRAAELGRYLDIDKKKIELEEAQLHTQAPDFWEDPKKAEKQMKTERNLSVGSMVIRKFAQMLTNFPLPLISIRKVWWRKKRLMTLMPKPLRR